MNYTTDYHLPQWAADDRIMREDFNDAMEAIDTAIGGKATAGALGTEVTTRENADTALSERIDSEAAARAAAVAAISANLGSHGRNLRIVIGSYDGTGSHGSNNPNSLTFDFVPVLVLISMKAANGAINMCHLARPNTRAASEGVGLYLSWADHGVSWYNGNTSDSAAEYQLNKSGTTYNYLAFGYDGEA